MSVARRLLSLVSLSQDDAPSNPDRSLIIQATHGSPDHPLRIGEIEIPCYVLEDGRRVLVQGGMMSALDMSQGTASRGVRGDRLAKFIRGKAIQRFVPHALADLITEPIRFRTPSGTEAYGYEAKVLADLCDVIIKARSEGNLNYQTIHIADRAEILSRGFRHVGIIALVDEATGFQEFRTRRALEEILEEFVSKELLKWVKTFPDDFYRELFRLRNWHYAPNSVKRPSVIGHMTNDLVYRRLAPGVLEELKRQTPRDERGRPKAKYFQHLTDDVGHPRLREHLAAVIALMKASTTWAGFHRSMQRALPLYDTTMPMPLDFPDEDIG